MKLKTKKDREIYEEAAQGGYKTGNMDGSMEEAKKSLTRRFTDREIDAIVSIVWFSPALQSIRNRVGKLEKRE